MTKLRDLLKRFVEYLRHGIWQKDDQFGTGKSLWLTRQARVIVYTVRGVTQHGSIIRAAALTFYTLMSIVPILALAFGVIKGFGLDEQLVSFLSGRFEQYNEIIDRLLAMASNVLENTKGGVVALSGFVLLIWAAVRVFSNVENAFNTIWEIHKSRSLTHKVSAYAAVIFLLPLAWVMLSVIITYIQNILNQYRYLPGGILYTLGSLAVIWLIFTAMYKIIPNTKVKLRNAAVAAAIASVAFMVFQMIYVYIQSSVNAYNIIYGSFAAIPLFLIWLQISWMIILFGAELSFSYQNIESYRQERDSLDVSYDNRRKITVAVMLVIVRHFTEDRELPTSEGIAKYLRLPLRIVRDVLSDLEEAGLIVALRTEGNEKVRRYLPAHDTASLTFYGILEATEATGKKIVDADSEIPEMRRVNSILDEIKERVSQSRSNVPLSVILQDEDIDSGKRKRG